jgi:hypothetical protein
MTWKPYCCLSLLDQGHSLDVIIYHHHIDFGWASTSVISFSINSLSFSVFPSLYVSSQFIIDKRLQGVLHHGLHWSFLSFVTSRTSHFEDRSLLHATPCLAPKFAIDVSYVFSRYRIYIFLREEESLSCLRLTNEVISTSTTTLYRGYVNWG